METIRKNIENLMQIEGLDGNEVASKAGYDLKTFNELLSGQIDLSDSDLFCISQALGVTPNDLMKDVTNN